MALPNLNTFYKGFLVEDNEKARVKEKNSPSSSEVQESKDPSSSSNRAEGGGGSEVESQDPNGNTGSNQRKKESVLDVDFQTVEDQQTHNEEPQPKSSKNVDSEVQTLPFTVHLDRFLSRFLLTRKESRIRWEIAANLFLILQNQGYPKCELQVYGSLLFDLSNAKSDINISLDLRGDDEGGASLDKQKSGRPLAIERDLEAVSEILKNSCSPHNSKERFAEEVEVKLIDTQAPILKFKHVQTGVEVNISFGNRHHVQTSKLLQLFIEFDPRVKPFLNFIRYWADFHGISKNIPNYALSLLALVYLTAKKIIPPIKILQTLAASQRIQDQEKNQDLIDEWDCSFCTDKDLIEALFDPAPLPEKYEDNYGNILLEMAEEFFEMILGINFSKSVVCTFMGKIVPKDSFLLESASSKKILSGKLVEWLKTYGGSDRIVSEDLGFSNPLVVQDPFVLNLNVGGCVEKTGLNQFIDLCVTTVLELCEMSRFSPDSCRESINFEEID